MRSEELAVDILIVHWEKMRMERNHKIEKVTDNPFLNLYHMDTRTKNGNRMDYYFASRNGEEEIKARTHSTRGEGMAVYAVTRENPSRLVMIRQYRYPLDDFIYEIPAGLVEADETAEAAAVREMKEETGLELDIYEGGEPYFRGPFFLAQGITDESGKIIYGYADGEVNLNAQEESEEIEVCFVDKKEGRRILAEERVSVRAALLLIQFLQANEQEPFAFLNE